MFGRPALTNPNWPLFAARELGREDPFSLLAADWAWWLRTSQADEASIGRLPAKSPAESVDLMASA